jgi:predicted RNA-binding Zn-ribbon protein involved in translation (DUF1610 family)
MRFYRGQGKGRNAQEGNRGQGGMGPGGYCVCLKCGYRIPKQRGVRCMDLHCPKCGAVMVREGSYHHNLYLQKKEKLNKEGK